MPIEREQIVDTALALAEERGWEAVRLFDVAIRLNATLDDIRIYFREKEDLVEAWFDRADAAMLQAAAAPEIAALPTRERLHWVMMRWMQTLEPHRRVTRQMIWAKCEFGHLHIQIPGLMRISRTVQWMREAAYRDAVLPYRALEETVLTSIYLATFVHWLNDESAGSIETHRLLDRLLGMAEGMVMRLPNFLRSGFSESKPGAMPNE